MVTLLHTKLGSSCLRRAWCVLKGAGLMLGVYVLLTYLTKDEGNTLIHSVWRLSNQSDKVLHPLDSRHDSRYTLMERPVFLNGRPIHDVVNKEPAQPWASGDPQRYFPQPRLSTRVFSTFTLTQTEHSDLHILQNMGVVLAATPVVPDDTKIILWYTKTRYFPVLKNIHLLRGCPEMKCRITTNRYFYNQSDALLFTAQLIHDPAPVKLHDQVWILQNHESPLLSWVKKSPIFKDDWRSKFNWTMDYRTNADLWAPYALFQTANNQFLRRPPSADKNYTEIVRSKKGVVAWMVSHCKTQGKREDYVKELQKYVRVDVFGHCGSYTCARSHDEKCLREMAQKYKFYLAFENAFCKDYITEKLFRYFQSDMVLIVRGGGNYSRILPPQTVINTADFQTTRQLAEYINMLDADDEKYIQHLKNKDGYESVWEEWPIVKNSKIPYMTYHYDAVTYCEICRRLWNPKKYRKTYRDIGAWFRQGQCYAPTDI